MKKFIILFLVICLYSCESKESRYKYVKIEELSRRIDSLENDNHNLQIQIISQEELIYSQDTMIRNLKKEKE